MNKTFVFSSYGFFSLQHSVKWEYSSGSVEARTIYPASIFILFFNRWDGFCPGRPLGESTPDIVLYLARTQSRVTHFTQTSAFRRMGNFSKASEKTPKATSDIAMQRSEKKAWARARDVSRAVLVRELIIPS